MPDRPSDPIALARPLVAEAIGTFALCFIGILSINAGGIGGLVGIAAIPSLATVAFAHGLTIAVMVAALGAVSGGHFNPAVTCGFLVTGRMAPGRAMAYWGAQLVGAILAAWLIAASFGGGDATAPGVPVLNPEVSMAGGVMLEAVGTFFLVLVVFGTAVDSRAPKSVFPFAIGLTIALDIMAVGPLTGGSVNPARYLGPALVTDVFGTFKHFDAWDGGRFPVVYLLGPLIGGALAGLLMHRFFMERAPSPTVAARGGPAPSEER
jgi:aquaporin Z